jgi:hypothetical protein
MTLHPVNNNVRYLPGRTSANYGSCMRVRSVSAQGRQYEQVTRKTFWHVGAEP